jgi:hypothetical protein
MTERRLLAAIAALWVLGMAAGIAAEHRKDH